MEFTLINSPLFHNNSGHDQEDSLPPLGLGYIATNLINNGIKVEFIDAVNDNISLYNLIEKLYSSKPDFIGINIFTTNYMIVNELIDSIIFKTHFIVGGPGTKKLHNKIINNKSHNLIDVIIGDGELITVDIVKNMAKESPIIENQNRRVYNIDENSIYFLNDISNFQLNRDLFGMEPKKNILGFQEVNVVTGRGCIYNCSFCGAARQQNPKCPVRERSEISIISELIEIRSKYPDCNSIRILDDLFLKNAISISKAIKIFSQFDFQWRSMAHIKTFNNVGQYRIEELKESGCKEIFIGIESGSQRILSSINKTTDKSLILSTLNRIFSAGINVKGYFIYGFPEETQDDMELTFNLASEIKKLSLKNNVSFRTSVFQFRPYHGTKIFSELKVKYPDIDDQKVSYNKALSNLIGRDQFNFQSNNYSKVSLRTIHDYICITNNLNGSRTVFKSNSRFNRYKHKEEV